jgi:hypothetical protein
MNRFRFLPLAAILAVSFALAVPAHAQGRINTPGTYDASAVYIPGLTPPGGLPDCVDKFDQQIYVGTITVIPNNSGFKVTFEGTNQDDPKLNVKATGIFSPLWGGFQLGPLGGRNDAIIGIDAVTMLSGSVSGRVLGENGKPGHVVAKVGPGGVFQSCKFTGQGAK